MSLGSSRARLMGALKDLHARLDRSRPDWDDVVRKEFEREFIEPLEAIVRAAVSAMETMDQHLHQARRECE